MNNTLFLTGITVRKEALQWKIFATVKITAKKQNYMNNRFFERALMWEIFTGKITTKKQNGMNNTLFKQALLWEISGKKEK